MDDTKPKTDTTLPVVEIVDKKPEMPKVTEHPISEAEAKKFAGQGDFDLPVSPLDELIGGVKKADKLEAAVPVEGPGVVEKAQQPAKEMAATQVTSTQIPPTPAPAVPVKAVSSVSPMPVPGVGSTKDLEKQARAMLSEMKPTKTEVKKNLIDVGSGVKKKRGGGAAMKMALAAVVVVMMGAGGVVGMNLLKMQQVAENRSQAIVPCEDSSDCFNGYYCKNGQCVPPTPVPTASTIPSPPAVCVVAGDSCTADSQCCDGNCTRYGVCGDDTTTIPPPVCGSDTLAGFSCVDSTYNCQSVRTDATGCAGGQKCGQTCSAPTPTDACTQHRSDYYGGKIIACGVCADGDDPADASVVNGGGYGCKSANAMAHFVCQGIIPSSQGCGYDNGTKVFDGGGSVTFTEADCGMEQIDTAGGFISIIRDIPCSSSPPPTDTPTPNPFICAGLTSTAGTAPKIGDTVTLTCSHEGDGFSAYKYQYKIGSGTSYNPLASNTLEINSAGVYTVQCQACKTDGSCTAWGVGAIQ